jgi:ABC-2 type transport system ATP-binding protein
MPSSETSAIVARDLRKVYGDEVAVADLSLSIPPGTVYGFLGPNGAGKTTTMRLLTGLTEPTAGHAEIRGTPVTDRRAIASSVGYLPETPPLYDEFSAAEQLEYVADLHDVAPAVARERIDAYLEAFDLVDDADKRIGSYSKGMKRKTAFVQSVLHDPEVLFLDEPTAGLDPRAARRMRDAISRIADDGTTVFLSTHVLPVVEAVADEVGVLYDGDIVASGTPTAVSRRAETGTDGSLEDAFLAVTGESGVETGAQPSERQ